MIAILNNSIFDKAHEIFCDVGKIVVLDDSGAESTIRHNTNFNDSSYDNVYHSVYNTVSETVSQDLKIKS